MAEVAAAWLASQQALVGAGELAPRTFGADDVAVRIHLKPAMGSRAIRSLTANGVVGWPAAGTCGQRFFFGTHVR